MLTRRSILVGAVCLVFAAGLLTSSQLRADEAVDQKSAAEKAAARKEAVQKGLRDVKAALVARNATALDKACAALSRVGGSRAIQGLLDLLGKVPPGEDGLYWSLAGGVVSFGDEEALLRLGEYLQRRARNPVARDLLIALARNPSPHLAAAMESLARRGSEDVKLLVAERIGRVRSPRSVDVLIAMLQDEAARKPERPTELMRRIVRGLEWITGEDFGPSAVNWAGWWTRHRDRPLAGKGPGSRRSTGTAVDFLDFDRDAVFAGLEEAPPRRVVVLSGEFTREIQWDFNKDHIESVLQSMKVPHTVVRREDFMDFDLSTTSVIVVNCTQFIELCFCPDCKRGPKSVGKRAFQCVGCNKHIKRSARLSAVALEKLRDFVLRGGYLFCEDWNVKEIVPHVFPDFIGPGPQLAEASVDVMPVRGAAGHPYLRGVFDPPRRENRGFGGGFGERIIVLGEEEDEEDSSSSPTTVVFGSDQSESGEHAVDLKHRWLIDDESFSLHVENPRRVVTLLRSDRLRRAGDGDDAVAAVFRPGSGSRGRVPPGSSVPKGGAPGVVAVILSHFGKQSSQADEFALQNILLNFLLDAHLQQQRIPGWTEKLEKEMAEIQKKKREAAKKRRKRRRRPGS